MSIKKGFVARVIQFNKTVIGIEDHDISLLTDAETRFTSEALTEEAEELKVAHTSGDLLGCVDALVDIQVFAIGAMYKMGLDESKIKQCMLAVCDANDQKHGGQLNKARSESTVVDAVKPENWVGPEERIGEILES